MSSESCPCKRLFQNTEADPMSEDCLFLNVFVPTRNDSELMPILVYIHGGGFANGGISMKILDPPELAARGGLIVVVVAYRLGALGFLYMGVEDAPGNMGLYDQLLALHWVRDNARAFGGDADKVTIMGQSAGSISVGLHLISPKSGGLFRRAFMQSGKPLYPPRHHEQNAGRTEGERYRDLPQLQQRPVQFGKTWHKSCRGLPALQGLQGHSDGDRELPLKGPGRIFPSQRG
ncbi:hypothetical protein HPB48_012689 [Haemaphysalis longicornis]|uniref:Carboxylic ester hydrolase n=1 Tax=Haemaphysalis longicornis TaxID=44386 RepID=A0A9J6FZ73_HAELO|nr:hypothetical protein HPB48_012689 [Haemaphysalis longicornis]